MSVWDNAEFEDATNDIGPCSCACHFDDNGEPCRVCDCPDLDDDDSDN